MSTVAVMRKQLFINNEWRDASGGATLEVVNPATEEVIAAVASATQADVDAAVAAARVALDGPWGKVSARDRGRFVWKLGERLLERADEVARLETLHNGKPIFESRNIEIPAAAECFQYYAGWADKIHGETIPVKGNFLTYTLREPVGVVGAIVPWNFPLLLTAWKVAPALACGNTVIIKPASQTPLTALALAVLAERAGLPGGVLNIITGDAPAIGGVLTSHPAVKFVGFTGSTEVGKLL
ncbi:MAG TPA: aldehyde dehydrogenase family protein, partial [Mycobacterium sp.]|nr:aldehyde dehydrogenase family protein [Mycobacterium sp.]